MLGQKSVHASTQVSPEVSDRCGFVHNSFIDMRIDLYTDMRVNMSLQSVTVVDPFTTPYFR